MTNVFTPRPFQVDDQRVLSENNYTALLNIQPGGGKTAAALLAHKNSGARTTLVVAPEQTHKRAWREDAEWILGITPRTVGNSNKAQRDAMFDFKFGYEGIFLITPQLLTRIDTDEFGGDLCIVDEGHMLNNPGKKGQKQLQSLADKFAGKQFLSGTAWRNNFERSWSAMRFLWPELMYRGQVAYDNYFLWQRDRMDHVDEERPPRQWIPSTWDVFKNPPEGYWRKNIKGVPHIGQPVLGKKWLNESEPGRLISEAPCVITHLKREECCRFHTVAAQGYAGFLDLEEPQEIRHVIDLTRNQKQAIKDLEKQNLAWLEDNPLVVDLPITQKQRIRQLTLGEAGVEDYLGEDADGNEVVKQHLTWDESTKSPFTDELIGLLEELDGEPVVVYLEAQSFAAGTLVKRLNKAGFPTFEFSGKTRNTRDADLDKFGTEYQVAVVIISSGGVGLDGLQRVSKTEVWLERSVDETNNIQARSRQDRLGGIGQVQRHIFVDDLGYADGAYSDAVAKRLALQATLRKA